MDLFCGETFLKLKEKNEVHIPTHRNTDLIDHLRKSAAYLLEMTYGTLAVANLSHGS